MRTQPTIAPEIYIAIKSMHSRTSSGVMLISEWGCKSLNKEQSNNLYNRVCLRLGTFPISKTEQSTIVSFVLLVQGKWFCWKSCSELKFLLFLCLSLLASSHAKPNRSCLECPTAKCEISFPSLSNHSQNNAQNRPFVQGWLQAPTSGLGRLATPVTV